MVIAMSKPYVLVTNGVVQCEHGGTVVLKSAISGHVIGGKVPVDMESLPGSKIEGCPHRSSVNAQCKVVSSISSASTESNVGWSGKHYVVRTIGKTDKGAGLVLVDPGQGNHALNAPGGGSGDPVTLDVIAIDPKKAAEHLPGETCRFHPMRVSGDNLRPLRAYRNFDVFTDYHWAHTDVHTSDRVVTYTDAYLYVTHAGKTDEWRILSMGDPYRPAMGQVFYQRTEDGAVFTGVPFFKPEGDVEFLYANVKLSDADRGKFTPVKVTVTPAKTIYLNDYGEISKMVSIEAKVLKKKHLITADEAREGSDKAVATVITLEDPVGEVEDLYDDYEFSFSRHYFLNKPLFEDIEKCNRYSYAVADILDYIFVSDSEKSAHKKQNKELSESFERMKEMVCERLADKVYKKMGGHDLAKVIDKKLAQEYLDEVRFIAPELLERHHKVYLRIEDRTYVYASNRMHKGGLKLNFEGANKRAASDVLGLLVFSIAFSKQNETICDTQLLQEAEKFYFLLKNATPLPALSEKAREEVHEKLNHQQEMQRVFDGRDPLIDEFEQLDTLLQGIAFAPQNAQKLSASGGFGFDGLKINPDESRKIIIDGHVTPAKNLAGEIEKKLAGGVLQDVLHRYMTLLKADSFDFHYYLINLALSLFRPRIGIDAEAEAISPFNGACLKQRELMTFIANRTIKDKKDAVSDDIAKELYEAPAHPHYLKMVYTYIGHAWLEAPNANLPGRKEKSFFEKLFPSGSDKGRGSNAQGFLNAFNDSDGAFKTDTSKIHDNNFDKELQVKSADEKLFERLQQLNGISSYVGKFEDTAKTAEETTTTASTTNKNNKERNYGGRDSNAADPFAELRNNGAYKKLLTSTRALAFVMTVANIGSYLQGKEKLKIHNLVGFAGDVLSVSNELATIAGKQATKLPETLEHMTGLQKVVSKAHMKVIARFGVVGVVVGTLNELNELDFDENPDMFISVVLKNAIYLALLFTPAWVALGAVAVLELLWFFISDKIYQSKLELYLSDSLLYNQQVERGGQGRYHRKKGKSCHAGIMVKVLNALEPNAAFTLDGQSVKPEEGFLTADGVRRFIAENYSAYPHAFEIAQLTELTRLKSALYGFGVDVVDHESDVPVRARGAQFYLKVRQQLQLSKALYDVTETVWLSRTVDGNTRYTKLPKLHTYNLAGYFVNESDAFSKALGAMNFDALPPAMQAQAFNSVNRKSVADAILEGETRLIVATPEIVLKYAVTFVTANEAAAIVNGNAYAGISECENVILTKEDYAAIGKDQNA